ncbi:hypothetical protein [Neobacillus cucumis]|uniref:Uncharacterized protein n=1 Tax=Neobacillus cucumis TaxID=1740721 RepID=A0A2N5HBF5_9BACI|nr:hypothetical protein [Neobacillus cucumis]PLS02834.1 hypothetical protein CVD27_16720 [Neobacillus cucumis]
MEKGPQEYFGRVVGLRTILASVVKITSALSTGFLITKVGVNNIFLLFALFLVASFFTVKGLNKVYIPNLS